jgi:hypothetical protein
MVSVLVAVMLPLLVSSLYRLAQAIMEQTWNNHGKQSGNYHKKK